MLCVFALVDAHKKAPALKAIGASMRLNYVRD